MKIATMAVGSETLDREQIMPPRASAMSPADPPRTRGVPEAHEKLREDRARLAVGPDLALFPLYHPPII
jgi:hypothetical protein